MQFFLCYLFYKQVVVKLNILILVHFKYFFAFFDNFGNAYFSVGIFAVWTVHKISAYLSFSNSLAYGNALIEISVRDQIYLSRIYARAKCLKATYLHGELGVLVGHQVFNLSSLVNLLLVSSNFTFIYLRKKKRNKVIYNSQPLLKGQKIVLHVTA